MNFSNLEIEMKDGLTTLKIDGVDFPTVSELTLHAKVDEPPTLELKMYCINPEKNQSI